ncbi:DUF2178 domain-containing protein [Thermococcus sp. JCM 11816]|uniref:DUF2178 domain-containing protein n=1 Tax=Thermococcus sp. (strain JCM 11816 / KS-1) TaxID=1295125 RepID=UPI000A9133A7
MLKYEELLVVLVTGIVIGLAYSVKSGKGLLAVGIFLLGILLTYALNWYYNSRVERIEDERTEMINARSTRNAYALMSALLFAEYLWEYSNGNTGTATMLLIPPLVVGAFVLLVSQHWYERVM